MARYRQPQDSPGYDLVVGADGIGRNVLAARQPANVDMGQLTRARARQTEFDRRAKILGNTRPGTREANRKLNYNSPGERERDELGMKVGDAAMLKYGYTKGPWGHWQGNTTMTQVTKNPKNRQGLHTWQVQGSDQQYSSEAEAKWIANRTPTPSVYNRQNSGEEGGDPNKPEQRKMVMGGKHGQMIDEAYKTVLGREPDKDGADYWANKFVDEPNLTLEDLKKAFRASDEYKAGGGVDKMYESTSIDTGDDFGGGGPDGGAGDGFGGDDNGNGAINSSSTYNAYINELKSDIDAYEVTMQEELAQLKEMGKGAPLEDLDKEMDIINGNIDKAQRELEEEQRKQKELHDLPETAYTQGLKDVGIDSTHLNQEIAKQRRALVQKNLEASYVKEIDGLNDKRLSQIVQAKKQWEKGNYEMAQWAMEQAIKIEDNMTKKKQKLWDETLKWEESQRKDLKAEQELKEKEFEFSQDMAEGLAPAIYAQFGDDDDANAALVAAIAKENDISTTFLMSALQEYQVDYLGDLQNAQFTLGDHRYQLDPTTGEYEIVASKDAKSKTASASSISRYNNIQGWAQKVRDGSKDLKDVPSAYYNQVKDIIGGDDPTDTQDTTPTTSVEDVVDVDSGVSYLLEGNRYTDEEEFMFIVDKIYMDSNDARTQEEIAEELANAIQGGTGTVQSEYTGDDDGFWKSNWDALLRRMSS